MRKLFVLAALLLGALWSPRPSAQALEPFTAEEMLKVTTVSVLDLSEDGRRVAAGARRLYDNAETTTVGTEIPPTSHRRWWSC